MFKKQKTKTISCYPFPVSLFMQDSIGLLLDAVRTSNEDLAQTWKKSEQWATIEQLCSKFPLIRVISQINVNYLQDFTDSQVLFPYPNKNLI